MLSYIDKDITTIAAGIIAHGVNCSGAMNSGVAKAIKVKWPSVYEAFKRYPTGPTSLGKMDLIYVEDRGDSLLMVANCYTQLLYGYGGGKYADATAIGRSLQKVAQIANLHSCPIYIPRIGCGLGGLDWSQDVEPVIQPLFDIYDKLRIYVCDLPGDKNE